MRKLLYIIMCMATISACSGDYDEQVDLYQLEVALSFPEGSTVSPVGTRVELRNIRSNTTFVETADDAGVARFRVTAGIYEASVSMTQKLAANKVMVFNGMTKQFTMGQTAQQRIDISLKGSKLSPLVVKEIYNGGIMKDDGKAFHQDKCLILYNNSPSVLSLTDLCIGFVSPYNSQANNYWYDNEGKLVYESQGYVPVQDGIWYFPSALTIQPYSQIVVNCHGAIDNTLTYKESVNYANSDYYCMYDPEAGYTNPLYYPTPSDVIPTSHYLKAVKVGVSNAWAFSTSSPALVVFQTQGVTPTVFGTDVNNMTYIPKAAQTDVNKVLKVPTDWVLDGVEVFSAGSANSNLKRLTPTIDAGSVSLTNQHGHTLYRNVDKESTEALPENSGKLVYGYPTAVGATPDPTVIDAERSLKQGAHIVYQDTNNSTADFHEREKCSLRN